MVYDPSSMVNFKDLNPPHIYISVINDLVSDARAHRTCCTLLKSGAEVTLIGRRLKNSLTPGNWGYKTRRFSLLINKGMLFYLLYNIRLFLYLVSRKNTGILVACDLDTLPANYLASVCRKYTLVYDSHEYFTELPELQNRPFKKRIWLKLEKFLLPRIKYAYTVSDAIASEYTSKYHVKFEVVRNLPLKKTHNAKFPLPEKFRSKKRIIYQGAVNIGRGIEQMLETIKLMKDVVFIIAGDGDIYEDLRAKVTMENLEDKVYFTGRIPHGEVHELTSQADLGISLEQDLGMNYRYALPNKIFDYIQAGVPVLVSSLPEMSKLVKETGTGIVVDNFDPISLKEKVSFMLNSVEDRKIWKSNLAIAARELNWEKEENRLKEIFEKAGLTFHG